MSVVDSDAFYTQAFQSAMFVYFILFWFFFFRRNLICLQICAVLRMSRSQLIHMSSVVNLKTPTSYPRTAILGLVFGQDGEKA